MALELFKPFIYNYLEQKGLVSTVKSAKKMVEREPPEVWDILAEVIREHPVMTTARQFVGLAGTVSTAASVEQGLATYDRDAIHHFRLTKTMAEEIFRTLATEARDDRRHNPGLEEGRVDVIVGGMCILVQIMRSFGFDDCLVSEADILDGLVASQL